MAELQKQASELATLQAEVQELRQAQVNPAELARLRSETAQVLKLRNENAQLKRENSSFTAKKLHAEELQIESQLTPEKITQLVKENEQLRNEAQEAQILRERTEGGNNCIN